MDRLEVKASSLPFILVILLGLFFVPMGLISLITGLLKGFEIVPFAIGIMGLLLFALIVWIIRRALKTSVKCFSQEGLVLNDGQMFRWTDLNRVVDKVRIRPYNRKTFGGRKLSSKMVRPG